MDLPSFLIGIVIAWIIALLVYWYQSQRDHERDSSLVSYSDYIAGMEQSEARAAELQTRLQTAQADCAHEKAALQQQIEQLNQQVEQLDAQIEELDRTAQVNIAEPQAAESPLAAETIVEESAAEDVGATASGTESAPAPPTGAQTADDLKRIEGIGPKIEVILNNAGILTFAQLAAAGSERLQQLLGEAGDRYRMADPHTWPEQARLAAAGEWGELETMQDRLKGGR